MQYIRTEADGQFAFSETVDFLKIPSELYGFRNTQTDIATAFSGRRVFCFCGDVVIEEEELICQECGAKMHVHAHPEPITLRHVPLGGDLTCLRFPHNRFFCPSCGATRSQYLSFKAVGHLITEALCQYARDLLATGMYTNKAVGEITGLGKNVVKEIDKQRLQDKYTIDGVKLRKPEYQAKYLGIDEFKLHDGRRYATHIIDMERGHVLWIGHGKKKQIVYDFIDHVGMDWMEGVEAVACDMNSDFQEAFEERCEWIQPVFDYFHIVKNFNDKVVSEVRREEQRRLIEEGNIEAARSLKRTRYILTSSRVTLQKKDQEAAEGKVLSRSSELFHKEAVLRKSGYEAKYDALLAENELLFTLDLIKEKLSEAYRQTDEAIMAEMMIDIMDLCSAAKNRNLLWFKRLIENHFEGIIAHATYRISAGRIEGLNNKIKTLRRQGYGYPDDEYFFLKIFDISICLPTRDILNRSKNLLENSFTTNFTNKTNHPPRRLRGQSKRCWNMSLIFFAKKIKNFSKKC